MPRLAAIVALLLAAACGEEKEIREWTPEDHAHPPEAEVDPARVPQGEGGDAPQGTTTERAAAALWLMSCASCHGREGRGDGPERPPEAQMADLSDPAWQAAKTDEELAQVIATGRGLMPRFDDRINSFGIAALVAHIRQLSGEGHGPGQPEQPAPEQEPDQPEQPAPEQRPNQPAPPAPEQQRDQPAPPAQPQAPPPQPTPPQSE